jgi:hypothetical protein
LAHFGAHLDRCCRVVKMNKSPFSFFVDYNVLMKIIFWSAMAWSIQSYALTDSKSTCLSEYSLIKSFYKSYIKDIEHRYENQLSLKFSKSFNALLHEDKKNCSEKAGSDVCGWGADTNVYLDTQEQDPNLTFENAKFKLSNPKKGIVNIIFNVYPSMKDKEAQLFYQKKIQFKLIKENHQWVVDDIVYFRKDGAESSRKQIQDEIALYASRD